MIEQTIEQIKDLKSFINDLSKDFNVAMNFEECMAFTGFSKGYLYKLTSTRSIPHYKRGKFVFFNRKEVEEWLFENKVETILEMKTRFKKEAKNGKH